VPWGCALAPLSADGLPWARVSTSSVTFWFVILVLPAVAGQVRRSSASRSLAFGTCTCPGLPAPRQRWEGRCLRGNGARQTSRQGEVSGFGEHHSLMVD